jgi:hypothetical protein
MKKYNIKVLGYILLGFLIVFPLMTGCGESIDSGGGGKTGPGKGVGDATGGTAAYYKATADVLGTGSTLYAIYGINLAHNGRTQSSDAGSKWFYYYYNATTASAEYFSITPSEEVSTREGSGSFDSYKTYNLSLWYYDSDTALSVAETAGGAGFRLTYADAYIRAILYPRYLGYSAPVWVVSYYSSDYAHQLDVLVNAQTGVMISKSGPTAVVE